MLLFFGELSSNELSKIKSSFKAELKLLLENGFSFFKNFGTFTWFTIYEFVKRETGYFMNDLYLKDDLAYDEDLLDDYISSYCSRF